MTTMLVPSDSETIALGRAHLRAWFGLAEAHGTVYYSADKVERQGHGREVRLATISVLAAPALVRLWPSTGRAASAEELDAVALDWRFSWTRAAFFVARYDTSVGQDGGSVGQLARRLARLAFGPNAGPGPLKFQAF